MSILFVVTISEVDIILNKNSIPLFSLRKCTRVLGTQYGDRFLEGVEK